MTVCVVAKCGSNIFGASDRMITAGDVQFEPPFPKVVQLTNSIALLMAGDASLNSEILARVRRAIAARLAENADDWLPVEDAAEFYSNGFNEVKSKRAESALLRPLGLTLETFFERIGDLDTEFVRNTIYEMQHQKMPAVEAIVTGIDDEGAHIFTVIGGEMRCDDSIGFAAIGGGARHAEAQFMLLPTFWTAHFSLAALMTYVAKRRAEIAPGVGTETDMFTIGPNPGSLAPLVPEALEELPRIYKRMLRDEQRTASHSATMMGQFTKRLEVLKLERAAAADTQAQGE